MSDRPPSNLTTGELLGYWRDRARTSICGKVIGQINFLRPPDASVIVRCIREPHDDGHHMVDVDMLTGVPDGIPPLMVTAPLSAVTDVLPGPYADDLVHPGLHSDHSIAASEGTMSQELIDAALAIPMGGVDDGDHHKMWIIDQMVRALTGCPVGGESVEYLEFVAAYQYGEDGPETYTWDQGIAP
jgi:hypothetical protein